MAEELTMEQEFQKRVRQHKVEVVGNLYINMVVGRTTVGLSLPRFIEVENYKKLCFERAEELYDTNKDKFEELYNTGWEYFKQLDI